jgi:excisionase family DNA binding protein
MQARAGVPRLVSIKEVAERLGISPFGVRRHIHAKRLKGVKVGRRLMVSEATLLDAIEHGV